MNEISSTFRIYLELNIFNPLFTWCLTELYNERFLWNETQIFVMKWFVETVNH